MIARGAGLDPPRARQVGRERAAERARVRPARRAAGRNPSARRRAAGPCSSHQRLDLGERRAGLGREHQFLRLVQRHAGEPGEVERQVGLARPAERALGAAADDFERLALGQRPAHGVLDVLGVPGFQRVGHATVMQRIDERSLVVRRRNVVRRSPQPRLQVAARISAGRARRFLPRIGSARAGRRRPGSACRSRDSRISCPLAGLERIERAILFDTISAGVVIGAPAAFVDMAAGRPERSGLRRTAPTAEPAQRPSGAATAKTAITTGRRIGVSTVHVLSDRGPSYAAKRVKARRVSRPGARRRSPCRRSAASPARRASPRP